MNRRYVDTFTINLIRYLPVVLHLKGNFLVVRVKNRILNSSISLSVSETGPDSRSTHCAYIYQFKFKLMEYELLGGISTARVSTDWPLLPLLSYRKQVQPSLNSSKGPIFMDTFLQRIQTFKWDTAPDVYGPSGLRLENVA